MTCQEELRGPADVPGITPPAADTCEEADAMPQRSSPEMATEPARQDQIFVARKSKTIAKPKKKDLKKRPKAKKGQTATVPVESPTTESKEVACKTCGLTFRNGVALGGHVSKAHPGGSPTYKRKIEVREARAAERLFLEKAKVWFSDHFAADPKAQQSKSVITKVKVLLLNGRTPTVADFKRKMD